MFYVWPVLYCFVYWQESFLIGAVLSSTDAASVFAILRKKKLNLKDGTASILEVESGSNDPISYMLTIIAVSLMGDSETGSIAGLITLQIVFGILVGVLIAFLSLLILTKTNLVSEGLDTIFMIAMVIRGEENIIPDGKTVIQAGDVVVVYR